MVDVAQDTKTVSTPSESLPLSRIRLFMVGLGFSLVGIFVPGCISHRNVGAFSVALTALGLVKISVKMFRRHRYESFAGKEITPVMASYELSYNLMAVLGGIIVAYFVSTLVLPQRLVFSLFNLQIEGLALRGILEMSPFPSVFGISIFYWLVYIGVSFLMGALFKESGIALILAWLGSLWGVTLGLIFHPGGPAMRYVSGVGPIITFLSLGPGSAAFLLAGMTGLFLARGADKYSLTSPEYRGIIRTSIFILVLTLIVMLCVAAIDAYFMISIPR